MESKVQQFFFSILEYKFTAEVNERGKTSSEISIFISHCIHVVYRTKAFAVGTFS